MCRTSSGTARRASIYQGSEFTSWVIVKDYHVKLQFSKHLPLSDAPVGNCGPFLNLAKPNTASSWKVRNPLGTFVRVDRPWRADADPSSINQGRAAYPCYNTNSKLRKDKKSVRKLKEKRIQNIKGWSQMLPLFRELVEDLIYGEYFNPKHNWESINSEAGTDIGRRAHPWLQRTCFQMHRESTQQRHVRRTTWPDADLCRPKGAKRASSVHPLFAYFIVLPTLPSHVSPLLSPPSWLHQLKWKLFYSKYLWSPDCEGCICDS